MTSKRLFDIVFSFLGLILLSPLLIIVMLAIKIDSPGVIFFRQIRVGQYGKEFKIHKFRTMIINAENLGPKLTITNDTRITKLGKFLRLSKIDELAQLFDVLRGKMSLVGPRPELPCYVKYYPLALKELILSIKPGITDPTSIKLIDENKLITTSNLDPHQAYIQEILPLKLDSAALYVKHHSCWSDLIIIMQTFKKIITR